MSEQTLNTRLFSAVKGSWSRRVLVVRPIIPELESDSQTRDRFFNYMDTTRRLGSTISRTCKLLNHHHKAPLPPITVEPFDYPKRSTMKEVIKEDAKPHEVRVVVDLTRDTSIGVDKVEGLGFGSHLITFSGSEVPLDHGWRVCESAADVNICTSDVQFSSVLHDVVIDAAMFHARCSPLGIWNTIEQRRAFSRRKVEFARRNRLTSFFGPIRSAEVGYFALASAARTGEVFDAEACQRCVTLWDLFLSQEVEGLGLNPTQLATAVQSYVKRNHIKGGQLSPSKLRRRVAELPPGAWTLVVSQRRPRGERAKHVANLLGYPEWKNNQWNIMASTELDRVIPFLDYLHFFPLFVPLQNVGREG